MTTILSWNIQAGLGVDGRLDLARIGRTIARLADADVICLQEVERRVPPGDDDEPAEMPSNQFWALGDMFPDHAVIIGASVERAAEAPAEVPTPYLFGNMVLSRLPILSVFRHPLPQPAAPGIRHMPRQATEVTVRTKAGPLRVVTTHLEFHSEDHRRVQIGRMRDLHREVAAQARQPGTSADDGPYGAIARPAAMVLGGDFNMETGSDEYAAMTAPFEDGTPALIDAWPVVHADRPHDPTCGVFDHRQWPVGAHCRDFFFVTEDLQPRLRSFKVDLKTNASDHQPIVIDLADA